jgi:peptidylprolyl isomerase
MMKNSHILLAVILILLAVLMPGCKTGQSTAQAKDGDTVQVDYTGKLADGTVFDSSIGREPLEFKLGAGQLIPGFEKAVLGMKVGETKTVTIPSDEAYGPCREGLIVEVARDNLPSGLTPEVGQQMQMPLPGGGVTIITVIKVTDTTVTLDANHPLCGKDLTFEIKLLKIE